MRRALLTAVLCLAALFVLAAGTASAAVSAWSDPPENLSAEVSGDTVTLTWSSGAPAEAYGVYDGGRFVKTVTKPTATLKNVSAGPHSYQVSGRMRGEDGAWVFGKRCAAVTVTVSGWSDPPENLTAEVSGDTVTLTWNPVAPAEAYGVYDGGRFVRTVTKPTATLKGVSAGPHSYQVSGRMRGEDGAWVFGKRCAAVTVTVAAQEQPSLPGRVSGLRAVFTPAGGILVQWDAPEGADSFQVFLAETGAWSEGMIPVAATGTEAELPLTDPTVGETWYLWVRAVNGAGEGPLSERFDLTLTLGVPEPLGAEAVSATSFTVTWRPVPGATGYRVYTSVSAAPEGGMTCTECGGDATQAQVDGQAGRTNYFWITAQSGERESGLSERVSAEAPETLPRPALFQATGVAGGFTASWEAVSGAKFYRVYYSREGTWRSDLSSAMTGGTSVTVTGLAPGSWYVWVSAENAAGPGALSTRRLVQAEE